MTWLRTITVSGATGVAILLLAAGPAWAQAHAGGHQHDVTMPTSGLRAELVQDIEMVEGRFLALAEAMTGRYDWRPGDGVRSVGEVFMHIVGANYMLPTFVGIEPPEGVRFGETMPEIMAAMQEMEKTTDEAEIREALAHAFMHAKHAVARTSDEDLDAPVQLFGNETTKRRALNLLVTHMHEHLGQSIAYARTNGVVPPWSQGGS